MQVNAHQPLISFVVVGRNDNYGGNFLNRLTTSAGILKHLAVKQNIKLEFIVVDYNPPPNAKFLIEESGLKSDNHLRIRSVIVPAAFHEKIRENSKNPFFEYVAKNIGIRRAGGDLVAATNPDIIFSENILEQMAKLGPNRENIFYRASRHDLSIRLFPPELSPEQILEECPSLTTRVWTPLGLRYVSYPRWWRRFLNKPKPHNLKMAPLFNQLRDFLSPKNNNIHAAAAGDFTMTSWKNWDRTSAYIQLTSNAYTDGIMLYRFIRYGLKQTILPGPIYHINHDIIAPGRKTMTFAEYKEKGREILSMNKLPVRNANWGFPDEPFHEITG